MPKANWWHIYCSTTGHGGKGWDVPQFLAIRNVFREGNYTSSLLHLFCPWASAAIDSPNTSAENLLSKKAALLQKHGEFSPKNQKYNSAVFSLTASVLTQSNSYHFLYPSNKEVIQRDVKIARNTRSPKIFLTMNSLKFFDKFFLPKILTKNFWPKCFWTTFF